MVGDDRVHLYADDDGSDNQWNKERMNNEDGLMGNE
jgi:hypothetical protein